MPFQAAGATWLAARRRALLCDEMGLGKTPQAVLAADKIGARNVLVLAPAAVLVGWIRHFADWSPIDRPARMVRGPADADGGGLRVVSYDKARDPATLNALRSRRWDVLICDEADMLKSDNAARTQAVLGPFLTETGGLIACADRAWGLTGTPMPNRADDLWTLLRCFAPEALHSATGTIMSRASFVHVFCATKVMRLARGAPLTERVIGLKPGAIPELRGRVQAHILRRKMADVLPDLPPMTHETWTLQPGQHGAELAAALAQDEVLAALAPKLLAATLIYDDKGVADCAGQMLQEISEDSLSRLRRITGTIKARVLAEELAREMPASTEKLVVMGWHTEVLDTLHDGLAPFGVARLDGSTASGIRKDGRSDRQDAIDSFQTDPTVRVFLGQILAAGAGITLTSGAEMVMAEMSWSPRDNAQAVRRIRRIGQNRPTRVRYPVLAGTIDEAVVHLLRRKSADIAAVLD